MSAFMCRAEKWLNSPADRKILETFELWAKKEVEISTENIKIILKKYWKEQITKENTRTGTSRVYPYIEGVLIRNGHLIKSQVYLRVQQRLFELKDHTPRFQKDMKMNMIWKDRSSFRHVIEWMKQVCWRCDIYV